MVQFFILMTALLKICVSYYHNYGIAGKCFKICSSLGIGIKDTWSMIAMECQYNWYNSYASENNYPSLTETKKI